MLQLFCERQHRNRAERERELEAFRQALADVVDWETAWYEDDVVYMHT